MEVDGLVTALERIEHATRDFVHPGHKGESPAALLDVLQECGRALGHPYAIDPGLDDARYEASRHCAAVQENLLAVLEEVRQLNMTVSGLLPSLVRIADRE
ncbi:hypothetical protein [Reyranella sp.]|jgi:hypothetical protein|uniref:hypothetical protein n=1 Tax=Reyranella sp. TaxID=1929291 RepID=UPI003BAC96B0